MATITATPTDAPRTGSGARQRVRAALAQATRQAATAVSTVRHQPHNWSPVLTVGSLGSGVICAWETFGRGAAWGALAAAFALFDWQRDK